LLCVTRRGAVVSLRSPRGAQRLGTGRKGRAELRSAATSKGRCRPGEEANGALLPPSPEDGSADALVGAGAS
jgi:hypothetical protein